MCDYCNKINLRLLKIKMLALEIEQNNLQMRINFLDYKKSNNL